MQTHLSSCSEKNYSNNGCVMLKMLIGLLVVVLVVAAAVACGLALKGLEEKHAKRNLNSRIDTTPLQCFRQWQGDSQAKLMRLAYLTVCTLLSKGARTNSSDTFNFPPRKPTHIVACKTAGHNGGAQSSGRILCVNAYTSNN